MSAAVHQFFLFCFLLLINSTKSYNITSCIPNTSCQCYLTKSAFTLSNCSHTLSDIPIFNSNNITRIIARNAFTQWPSQLCKYSNIHILDLSGSYFNSEFVDLSCLTHIVHLNLSNTKLTKIPNFHKNFSNYLQILDLSNNNIKILDGIAFQSLNNLISLLLQNNPIESIEHLENLFNLTNVELINLHSSNFDVTLKQSLTIDQWIDISHQWENPTKIFTIRMNGIPLQRIIPKPDQFQIISVDAMKNILKMFINSTFISLSNTPICNCAHLRSYQRYFSYIDHQKKYSSPLFLSTKCLMPDGNTYAPLFDRLTYINLRCPILSKISFFPLLTSSSSTIYSVSISCFIIYLFVIC
ncbi:unnamed protein product [Adineta steineri]|uniref:Uncharacterized protein n=2 Tax=Adineta steineri TaxID=433720 RepID=A0A814Y8L6_9BILA|nr:unnamed protein product [Adineta steineri]